MCFSPIFSICLPLMKKKRRLFTFPQCFIYHALALYTYVFVLLFFFLIFYFLFFFNFKIFNSYMRSQTWTPLPPPSPQHPSGSSPCILTCILSCKNWIASLCLMQDTAFLELVHGDDLERCYGEGGGRGVHVWERM